jgi:DNA-binding XRE family transcriptional regulator
MTDPTEVTTVRVWDSYARRVELATRARHGASLSCVDISNSAEHMIVAFDKGQLIVRPGWQRVMRQVARTGRTPSPAPEPPTPSVPTPTLGPRVRAIRQHAGWSQPALAQACGFARQTLATIEDGRTPNPRIQTLLKLADVLHVSLDTLCGRGEAPGEATPWSP